MNEIKGEVLVPQNRFIPKCECKPISPVNARIRWRNFGNSRIVTLEVECKICETPYAAELPYAPDMVEPER